MINIKKSGFKKGKQHQRFQEKDDEILNACEIEIMNVTITIRFI